eukprot:tig00021760_g23430.t1
MSALNEVGFTTADPDEAMASPFKKSDNLERAVGHLLYAGTLRNWRFATVTPAEQVSEGQYVFVESSNGAGLQLVAEQVISVERVVESGAFGLWVDGGNIVANGVAASCSSVPSGDMAGWKVQAYYLLDQASIFFIGLIYPLFRLFAENPRLAFENYMHNSWTFHPHIRCCVAAALFVSVSHRLSAKAVTK